jgi:hypothetical protein
MLAVRVRVRLRVFRQQVVRFGAVEKSLATLKKLLATFKEEIKYSGDSVRHLLETKIVKV